MILAPLSIPPRAKRGLLRWRNSRARSYSLTFNSTPREAGIATSISLTLGNVAGFFQFHPARSGDCYLSSKHPSPPRPSFPFPPARSGDCYERNLTWGLALYCLSIPPRAKRGLLLLHNLHKSCGFVRFPLGRTAQTLKLSQTPKGLRKYPSPHCVLHLLQPFLRPQFRSPPQAWS